MTMLGPDRRLPGPRGRRRRAGRRRWPAASSRCGGEIRCSTPRSTRIDVDGRPGRPACAPRDGERFARPAGRGRRRGRARTSTAGCCAAEDVPGRVRRGRCARFQLDPGDGQGRLGPRPARCPWADHAAVRPGHRPRRRLRRADDRGARPGRGARRARPAVPAGRADDDDRPDPVAGRHRVDVGLHARAAAGASRDAGDERHPRRSGTTTTASGSPTGCRRGSRSSRPASARGSLARRVLGPARAGGAATPT